MKLGLMLGDSGAKRNLPVELVQRAEALGYPVCVAMLDLDHFKLYNDRLGHPAGDAMLRTVAQSWSGSLRSHDTLARDGGEEFCVILPNVDLEAEFLSQILARRAYEASLRMLEEEARRLRYLSDLLA